MIQDIFCKIINKELPAEIVYEDEEFLVIKDINPQAPVHLLVVPKKHFDQIYPALVDKGGVHAASHEDLDLLGNMILVAGKAAKLSGLENNGYRLIINQGEDGGQLVPHLHLHVLGGKKLGSKIVKE